MYRCTECREEFKEKPDYCTCGNDEFEEFSEPREISAGDGISERISLSKSSTKPIPAEKFFAIGFFFLCIILAIVPWLFKVEKVEKTTAASHEKTLKPAPGIETFWKDTPPQTKNSSVEIAIEKPIEVIINTSKPVQKTKNTDTMQKASTKSPQNPSKTKTKTNASAPAKNPTPQAKPVQKTQSSQKPQNQSAANTAPIKLPQSVLNQQKKDSKPESNTNAQPQTSTQNPKPVTPPSKVEEIPQMDKNEFLNYKGSIRSALLAKLNITAIQGSGDCAVEFSVDNSGKLINRNFIYKSNNKTVNDEVYFMLMRLPYYKQPPKHYNGEKIKLKFSFDNGYYEISFI